MYAWDVVGDVVCNMTLPMRRAWGCKAWGQDRSGAASPPGRPFGGEALFLGLTGLTDLYRSQGLRYNFNVLSIDVTNNSHQTEMTEIFKSSSSTSPGDPT